MQLMQLPLDWERKPEKIQACLDSNPDVNLFDSTCWKVSSIRLNGPSTYTLGTIGFSRVRGEFSVLAEGRHIFGRRPKPRVTKKT